MDVVSTGMGVMKHPRASGTMVREAGDGVKIWGVHPLGRN